jgi:hypothetical protein
MGNDNLLFSRLSGASSSTSPHIALLFHGCLSKRERTRFCGQEEVVRG